MINPLIYSLRGFTFNGKHNSEIGVFMNNRSIQPPSKKKIKETVPFMYGSYDFSTIGSNGEIIYDEREISIELGFYDDTKEELMKAYSKIMEWIFNVDGKAELIFDDDKDYYYMVEVDDSGEFEDIMNYGRLSIKLIAEPFKYGVDYATDSSWDLFNFEEDYIQASEYDIIGTESINIYNPKLLSRPMTINCESDMILVYKNKSYNLHVGDNAPYSLKLGTGLNVLTFTGNGHVKISFRKVNL